jgi:hypothetical protein
MVQKNSLWCPYVVQNLLLGARLKNKNASLMKKYILITLTLIFLVSYSYGQNQLEYGFKVGLNIANVDEVGTKGEGQFSEVSYDGLPTATGVRPQLGFWLAVPISEKLTLQPELLWTQKYLKYQSTNVEIDHTNFDYLSLPLLAAYRFHEHWSVELGPEISYLLAATLKDPGQTGAVLSTEIEDGDIDFGFNAGLKYQEENWVIGFRYHRSLTSFQTFNFFELSGVPAGDIKQYHQGLVLWVGYALKS